jgi:hypothetical protein
MRWDNGNSVAAGALITLIAMRRRWRLEPAGELETAWKPLESGCRCAEFMWMWRENGLEHYKHIDTRRYLILDAEGRSYVRQGGQLVRVDFRKSSAGLRRQSMSEVSIESIATAALFWLFYLRLPLASRAGAAFS